MHQPPAKHLSAVAAGAAVALDEALKERFPASDPVAIEIESPPKAPKGQ
ncbi:hypothetical protein [Massilia sp. DWR3-1-1]